MAKPVRIYVERADYHWLVGRFGNDGVPPAQGELIERARNHIASLENKIEAMNKAPKENMK